MYMPGKGTAPANSNDYRLESKELNFVKGKKKKKRMILLLWGSRAAVSHVRIPTSLF